MIKRRRIFFILLYPINMNSAAVWRKKAKILNFEYLLIVDMMPSSTTPKEHLNDDSVDKNPKIACNFEQSKVDKSKVKESREKESINLNNIDHNNARARENNQSLKN